MVICCASQFLEWQRGVDCHGDNNDNGDNGEHERANLLVSLMPICCLESELLLVKLMVSYCASQFTSSVNGDQCQ